MDITTLLTDLASVIHGTTINKVPNIYGIINRAARAVLLDVDPKETQRIVQLSQVFNDVFDYPIPPDVKGDRIVDVRIQGNRNPGETFAQTYSETFDITKNFTWQNTLYTQWNTGVKTIRLNAPFLTSPVNLCDTSTISGWSAVTGADSISLDTTNNVAGGGAIQYNLLAGSSSGYIEVDNLTAVDYSNYVDIATGFCWVYLPSGSDITSISIRWGSDSSNYYSYTATQTQQGTVFQNGWNLIALPWASATKTGTPDDTQYQYIRVTTNYDSTLQTGVKFCNLSFTLGYYFDLQYYSKYLFRDPVTNTFQQNVVDSSDNDKLINLDTESYNLLFNKCAFYVAQSLQGADAQYDALFWDSEYQNALSKYRAQNPSEAMNKGEPYYQNPYRGYSSQWPGLYWGTQ